MTTQITLFENAQPVPVYLQQSAVAKALADQMEGGLAGQKINRLSLRNSKFRFNKQGVEIGVSQAAHLDVVILAANPTVGRLWWEAGFDSDQAAQRPDCYSIDGKVPEADSPKVQSTLCATCPKNAKGSAKNGKGKACSYKKRVVVASPTAIMGDVFALDVSSMSMFGDDAPAERKFKLRGYIEALKVNGLIIPAVVTRLSFDDNESVPVLNFTPVRVLTAEEFAQVEQRVADPAVRDMLDDVDLKSEEGKPIGQAAPVQQIAPPAPTPAPAPPAAPAPAPAPAAAFPTGAAAPVAGAAHQPKPRGRPKQAEAVPAQAPPPQAPAADGGFAFGGAAATAMPAQQPAAPAAAPAASPAGGFQVDLDGFDV